MKIRNIIIILLIFIFSLFFLNCDALWQFLQDQGSDSALFCVLPAEIAQKLAPDGYDAGTLDNVDQQNDDPAETNDGLNSAAFMAGIVATIASQGTDLFNAIIDELSDVENLFEDEIFLTYDKGGKTYGVNIQNKSQTCYITYGEVSSKNDTNFSNGDALSQFVYDPREQDKGPNMAILLDEYSLKGKSKSRGARYLWLDIRSSSSKQTVGVKAYVEGDQAKYFEAVGGNIVLNKSSKLYEIEGVIKGHPLVSDSTLNPKYRVFAVMDDKNNGGVTAKLEDFGLQYTLSKSDLLDALGINDPIPFLNPTYEFTASLDYQIRNYIEGSSSVKGLDDIKVKGTLLELTKAMVKADSIESDTSGATSFLPSGELDFTSVLASKLKVGPPRNESSLDFYDNITNNGQWKSYSISDSALPNKNTFSDIND
jgi:hypothetical protein